MSWLLMNDAVDVDAGGRWAYVEERDLFVVGADNSSLSERGGTWSSLSERGDTRGFTMIELVVVVLMIAVIGGLMVPRLVGNERRRASAECDDVQRLFSTAASRSALSGQSVLIRYDGRSHVLSAKVLREVVERGEIRHAWTEDRMFVPIRLESLAFRRGSADEQELSAGGWEIVFPTGEPRPLAWLAFSANADPETAGWQVELLPDETGASKRSMRDRSRASEAGLFRKDLDAIGQGERAW